MKVNMTPNPLDVVTIHASQGDTEARQWGFELHNNGELIDTSDITEQLFFKAYKGGTEQLLPENGSTPTTSPFIGDIKYPQGLLTDQEFLYRESPTESDGLAKIQTIYGNTLKWNQLVQNGNFESINGWAFNNCSGVASNNVCTISVTAGTKGVNFGLSSANAVNKVVGHKYLFAFNVKVNVLKTNTLRLNLDESTHIDIPLTANVDTRYSTIFSATETSTRLFVYPWGVSLVELTGNETVNVHDYMFIDLTDIFGSTKADEIYAMEQSVSGSGVAYFRSLFPLPYYQYDSGSLLPFRGEGLKTVGKNLLDKTSFSENSNARPEQTSTGVKVISKNGVSYGNVGTVAISDLTPYIGKTFVLSADVQTSNRSGLALQVRDENNAEKAWCATYTAGSVYVSLTITDDFRGCHLRVLIYAVGGSSGAVGDYSIYDNLQLEFGTEPTSYEPYTESTLSLPISTYFPNGMNGVNDVHDELRENGTTLKMYMVNLGTFNWNAEHEYASGQFRTSLVGNIGIPIPKYNTNFICSKYANGGLKNYLTVEDKTIAYTNGTAINPSSTIIRIHDSSCASMTASEFKESLQNVYLCYQLETPIETPITTASLVTENAEIPLSNEDGTLIGKCTEQLSSESGFFDAKIKLADEDGECYSNKIQLHVERSPQ